MDIVRFKFQHYLGCTPEEWLMKNGIRVKTHKEAFCLMYYENKESGVGFMVWNSRDGVTPFILFEEGKEYLHKHWFMDKAVFNPEYISKEILVPGQRIFRDTTPKEAENRAQKAMISFNQATIFKVEEGTKQWNELKNEYSQRFLEDPNIITLSEIPGPEKQDSKES